MGGTSERMAAQLILGKEVAEEVFADLRTRIAALKEAGVTPGLGVIIVGEDPASQVYVRNKVRMCEELGMRSFRIDLPAGISQDQLMAKVEELNSDPSVHAFLVQLPLPKGLDENAVINAIDPRKDADCFHPENVGRMLIGEPSFLPATPAGVMEMLRRRNIETRGKHAVVIGRSNIVGKPMAALLEQKGVDATVTVANSYTPNLPEILRTADIIVAAVGRPGTVTGDMVKDGAVVIDVGTNRVDDPGSPKGWKLVGDVDFDSVSPKASWITPVPRGVGPMTICMLMANAVRAAEEASR